MMSSQKNSFEEMIKDMKKAKGNISIDYMVSKRRYDKRRVYDLFNVLSAVDVCRRVDTKSYMWLGVGAVAEVMVRMAMQLELETMACSDLSVMRLTENSRICDIVRNFIYLFLYFGVNEIRVQDAARILSSDSVEPRRVLRRLYLITQILENVHLFEHTLQKGVYRIALNVVPITEEAYRRLKDEGMIPPDSVLSHINAFEKQYLHRIHKERQIAAQIAVSRTEEEAPLTCMTRAIAKERPNVSYTAGNREVLA